MLAIQLLILEMDLLGLILVEILTTDQYLDQRLTMEVGLIPLQQTIK